MSFIEDVNKTLVKSGMEAGRGAPPRFWFSTGNFVLNKIFSGSYYRGYPQGRILCLAGPSQSGKSFLTANAMKAAQEDDAYVVALDSENALDDDFASAIGVDVSSNYTHVHVNTMSDFKKASTSVIEGYRAQYGEDADAPKVLLVCDSLDMLETETESDHYRKGRVVGDQGQRSKQLKSILRPLVHAIKNLNISMIVTHQVYKNQDIRNGEGVWIVNDAIKYSLSQILLLKKLKLKDGEDKSKVEGIRMVCEGYKTRFTKPYQTVTIEVPYDTGMDKFNGLLESAEGIGVVSKGGSWYQYKTGKDENSIVKFQKKDFDKYKEAVLVECESKRSRFLEADLSNEKIDNEPQTSAKKKRVNKAKEDAVM